MTAPCASGLPAAIISPSRRGAWHALWAGGKSTSRPDDIHPNNLIAAIWGEEALHTEADVNHLIYELRQKLEPNPKEPEFLQTVRGLGYRLVTRPLT